VPGRKSNRVYSVKQFAQTPGSKCLSIARWVRTELAAKIALRACSESIGALAPILQPFISGDVARGMVDDAGPLHPATAEQYRERAKLIRRQVETLSNSDVRRQLLAIADQYDRLTESMERSRWG
jgi:hypothetical protein